MADQPRAIDANIVLRYLLRDTPDQSERARDLIESEAVLALTAVALAEVAWTLAGPRHHRSRGIVALELIAFLARENLICVGFDKAEAQQALLACVPDVGGADLGDALIAASARSAGILEIYSFDQHFARAGLTPISLD